MGRVSIEIAPVPQTVIDAVIARALDEDAPTGDLSAQTFVPASLTTTARVVAREPGVMAGGAVFATAMEQAAYRTQAPGAPAGSVPLAAGAAGTVSVRQLVAEGAPFSTGDALIEVSGPAHAVLLGERTGLNLLQRLCAIAALTARYVAAANAGRAQSDPEHGTTARPVRVVDTRKTTPGLRTLEKYAVRAGGGHNHRAGLSDAVMLKDNHLALLGEGEALTAALRAGKEKLGHTTHLEVEVDRFEQIEPVLAAGVDTIMLDNFGPAELARGVAQVAGRALVEASGGVNLETIGAIAASGVDIVSVGALTHSVVNLDLGLDTVEDALTV